MHYDFRTRGVCSRMIHIDLDESRQTIESVVFDGGCPGNLAAISKLVAGMEVEKVIDLLEGNTCDGRPTSCGDQLARGLRSAQMAKSDVYLEPVFARNRLTF